MMVKQTKFTIPLSSGERTKLTDAAKRLKLSPVEWARKVLVESVELKKPDVETVVLPHPICREKCALLDPFYIMPNREAFPALIDEARSEFPLAHNDRLKTTKEDENYLLGILHGDQPPPKSPVRYTGVTWMRNGRKMWELERDNGAKFSTFDPPKR